MAMHIIDPSRYLDGAHTGAVCGIWMKPDSPKWAKPWFLADCPECLRWMPDPSAAACRWTCLRDAVIEAVVSAFRPSQWGAPLDSPGPVIRIGAGGYDGDCVA